MDVRDEGILFSVSAISKTHKPGKRPIFRGVGKTGGSKTMPGIRVQLNPLPPFRKRCCGTFGATLNRTLTFPPGVNTSESDPKSSNPKQAKGGGGGVKWTPFKILASEIESAPSTPPPSRDSVQIADCTMEDACVADVCEHCRLSQLAGVGVRPIPRVVGVRPIPRV